MASKVNNDAAAARAAAAAAAAAEARREAEARAAAAAKAAAAAAAAAAKAKQTLGPVKKDELSTGKGGALRRSAVSKLGATGLPSVPASVVPAGGAKTFKPNELLLKANDVKTGTPPTAPKDDSYDRLEAHRAQAAQQQALDSATKGLPPEKAKQVQDAAKAVVAAQNGVTDPGKRARATADAIAAQSAQFKADPAAAKAFTTAIAPQVESVGRDLSNTIVPVTHDDPNTQPCIEALAKAADNLGAGAGLKLGQFLSNGVPDTKDLNHFDDSLKRVAEHSDGGVALLFGAAKGFTAQGKNASAGDLQSELREATLGLSPGDLMRPVDPKDPDAVGKAELTLAEARSMIDTAGMDKDSYYAAVLQQQLGAFKDDPAGKQALAQTQVKNIEELASRSSLNGTQLSVALDAAQAAGGGELEKVTDAYAKQLGQTRLDLSEVARQVSPEAAKALAFSFSKVGNAEMAQVFAGRAAQQLDGVASKAKDANDKVAELQGTLEKELANVSAALTPKQREEYEARFWDKHHAAIDEQKSANADLQHALSADLPTLKALAAINPAAAKSVTSCLSELARDPTQAAFVQKTVVGLKEANGAFPAGFKDSEVGLAKADAAATNTLANKALAEGDAEGAAEQLEKLHTFLENTTWATKDVNEFVTKSLPALKSFTAVVADAAKSHDLSKISAYLKDQAKVQELEAAGKVGGDLGSLVGNITKAVGVAAYLTDAAKSTDGKQQVLDVLKAGQGSAELLADGFKAFSAATKDATNQVLRGGGEALGRLSETIEKCTPVLSLGISVLQDASSIADAINNPSVKTVGAAVGDTLTAVGAAVALVPGGEVIGGALAIIGSGVSIVSGFVQGIVDDNHRKDEEKSLLADVFKGSAKDPSSPLYGLSDSQASDAAARIANTGANLNDLAKDAGLTPDQLVRLAVATPVMGEPFFGNMNDVATYSGLKGQAFVDWVTKLGNDTLEEKLMTWATSGQKAGLQQSAGQQADWYAQQQLLKGGDYATAYQQKYQELYDRDMKAVLQAQGLIP